MLGTDGTSAGHAAQVAMVASAAKPPSTRADLAGSLRVELAGKQVLSLDVFDTCLLRLVGHPTNVFDVMEAQLAKDASLPGRERLTPGFAALRIWAEEQARTRLLAKRKSAEVTFDEIYQEVQGATGVAPETIEQVKQLEKNCERLLIIQNPEILELVHDAAGQGMQVVYVSDMYHSAQFIAELLSAVGFPVDPGKVYASSDCRRSKASGDLYELVSAELNIPLRHFVHVGDNEHADVIMARRSGASAHHYRKLGDRLTEADMVGRELAPMLPVPERSLAYGIRNATLCADKIAAYACGGEQDFWYRLGYERAGILFVGFTLWLVEQCERDGLDMMVFLARDGHIMKECFDLVCAWKGMSIKSVYMYASRRAIVFPALFSVDDDSLTFVLGGRYQTVRYYLDRCGLNADAYFREAVQCGFTSPDDTIKSWDDLMRLRTMFQKLARPLLRTAAAESKLVTRHMDDIGIPRDGRIGVADIGWLGSMQEAFEKLAALTGRSCSVVGYYVGVRAEAKARTDKGMKMKGYLTSLGKPDDMNLLVHECVELLEFLFLAPHGSCLGFRNGDGQAIPVLEDNEAEVENIGKALRVREGILAFLHSTRPLIERFSGLTLDPRGAFYPYAQVIFSPTVEEATRLGDLTHVEGFGKSERKRIADPNEDLGRKRSDGSRIYWKIGYEKRRSHRRRILERFAR